MECRRQVGASAGMVFPSDGWDLLGDGPVLTGSPTLSLGCHLAPFKLGELRVRAFGSMTTAPLQRHWYRDLGQAGLYVMPSFGLTFGNGGVRYSLLESIRAYADDKLGDAGDSGSTLRGTDAPARP